ncbi:sensor domain-containing diguanylate cyclase [Rubrimonas cliftonensis]|uniref:diguanylate cyclase n=1 Tax=Rubrimonas cliftonensis TaxID=89524 RepID=A0A1H4A915_9RHOB|nr:diguanylate cyclase [Rubrimonas cliftonensis]SEA32485.1 diguanylate cyclase (GGDEF) domain-containing protein [Rubrimonas cliftonensis]
MRDETIEPDDAARDRPAWREDWAPASAVRSSGAARSGGREAVEAAARPAIAPFGGGMDVEAWPVGVVQADAGGRIVACNEAALELMGAEAPRPGTGLADLLRVPAPDLTAAAIAAMRRGEALRRRLRAASGAIAALTLMRAPCGGYTALLVNDAVAAEAQQEAHRQRARFAALADIADGPAIFCVDRAGRISAWSRSAERLERLSAGDALGMTLDALLDRASFTADAGALLGEAARAGEASATGFGWGEGGRARWMRLSVRAVRGADGALDSYVAMVGDQAADGEQGADLRSLAALDPLTGLLNRRGFFETAQTVRAGVARRGATMSLIAFDIDRFKRLNDGCGHAAGDAALVALADAARSEIRAGDLLGRIGGDEFALALPRADLARAAAIAERVRAAVAAARPTAGGRRLAFTASFGVTELRNAGESLHEALARADAALYVAKARGRDRVATA